MKNLFLFCLISFPSFAQVQIQVVDPELDASSLEEKYNVQYKEKVHNSLPDKDQRDELLEGVKAPLKWDELKKDIFYMDLKSKAIPELLKKYPDVNAQEMKHLKAKRG